MPELLECTPATKIAAGAVAVLSLLTFIIGIIASSAHIIDEGNVGVYFVQGALSDDITLPGRHYSLPFVTEMVQVTTRPMTSHLRDIDTITRDGIQNSFTGIQVISTINT